MRLTLTTGCSSSTIEPLLCSAWPELPWALPPNTLETPSGVSSVHYCHLDHHSPLQLWVPGYQFWPGAGLLLDTRDVLHTSAVPTAHEVYCGAGGGGEWGWCSGHCLLSVGHLLHGHPGLEILSFTIWLPSQSPILGWSLLCSLLHLVYPGGWTDAIIRDWRQVPRDDCRGYEVWRWCGHGGCRGEVCQIFQVNIASQLVVLWVLCAM